jgi:hypothetical protein
LLDALATCRNAGLCGAAVWRWTEPQSHGGDHAIGRVNPADLIAWNTPERTAGQGI